MVKHLFMQSQEGLDFFFKNVDQNSVEKVLQTCLKTSGMIVLTGVGKSGIVAEKIAMTMISTGTRALFVPPSNFLHGDIGILSENDLLIVLSKSGDSEELLDLIPFAKKRNTPVIAVVSKKNSRLENVCDQVVFLPVQKELGPLDLVPTTSTTVQLIFGDILTIGLMREKQVSLEQYAQNHPEGAIGKKLSIKVHDLMLTKERLPLCLPHERIIDVLVELSDKKCGCLLVVDGAQKLLGVFTDGDLRRSLQIYGSEILEKTLEGLMTKTPITIEKDILAWEAMKKMQGDPKKWIMVVPVVEEDRVIGLLKMHDIIHAGI